MTTLDNAPARGRSFSNEQAQISALMLLYLVLLCISLIAVSGDVSPAYHIGYNRQFVVAASISVAALGCFFQLFSIARFSFGYVVSFYMLSIVAGYLWLSYFTPLEYDHEGARWSAAVSFAAFLIPAIIITKPVISKWWTLTVAQMDVLATCLLMACVLVLAYGAQFGFHTVGFIDGEALRAQLSYPTWMNYAIPISTSALLPFSFAWFVLRKRFVFASIVIIVAMAFYPITINKTTLIAPFWLLSLALMLAFLRARTVVMLSLLCPLVLGFLAKLIDPSSPELVFRLINFRMLAIPSSGLDHYYHFFAAHPVTNFCQISIVGKLFSCSLPEPLAVTMAKEYAVGNYNASFFATEGIASVGIYLAPIAAFLCGLVISVGNLASAGLRPQFIFLSSCILAQTLIDTPLSITMLTHGGIATFMLWLVTPRDVATIDPANIQTKA
jgi:hypothetical protein